MAQSSEKAGGGEERHQAGDGRRGGGVRCRHAGLRGGEERSLLLLLNHMVFYALELDKMESRKKKKQVTTSMVVTLMMTTMRSTRNSNDVYDFDTGVDKNKKESVVNLVGSHTGIFVAANVCLALGFIGLTLVAVEAGNMCSILFLTCAIICGFIYQCDESFSLEWNCSFRWKETKKLEKCHLWLDLGLKKAQR